MTRYSALADKLEGLRNGVKPVNKCSTREAIDLNTFFESVKEQIDTEIQKANVELVRRKLDIIERVFVPCYRGKLCLTFGTALRCNVDLDETSWRIRLVISGPPNGLVIVKREYLTRLEPAEPHASPKGWSDTPAAGRSPGSIAGEIVSELFEEAIRLMENSPRHLELPEESSLVTHDPRLFAELWISLSSLLSSYTAAYGLSRNCQATVETGEEQITVRHGEKSLTLERINAIVSWTRENGTNGIMELTEHGRLLGPEGEHEMDHAAEIWARDLMQRKNQLQFAELTR